MRLASRPEALRSNGYLIGGSGNTNDRQRQWNNMERQWSNKERQWQHNDRQWPHDERRWNQHRQVFSYRPSGSSRPARGTAAAAPSVQNGRQIRMEGSERAVKRARTRQWQGQQPASERQCLTRPESPSSSPTTEVLWWQQRVGKGKQRNQHCGNAAKGGGRRALRTHLEEERGGERKGSSEMQRKESWCAPLTSRSVAS